MKYLLYRNITLSAALLGLASCNQALTVSKNSMSGGGGGEGKIEVTLIAKDYDYDYDLNQPVDLTIPISPLSVVPNGFDGSFVSGPYLNKGTENLSVNAGYSMKYENIRFKLKNTGEGKLTVQGVTVSYPDPNVIMGPVSYPLVINPNSEYEISLDGQCEDVDWDSTLNVLKLSIDLDGSPDFNSDIIVNCGY